LVAIIINFRKAEGGGGGGGFESLRQFNMHFSFLYSFGRFLGRIATFGLILMQFRHPAPIKILLYLLNSMPPLAYPASNATDLHIHRHSIFR
jgi:hypothetical protein